MNFIQQLPATLGAWSIQFLSKIAFLVQSKHSTWFIRLIGRTFSLLSKTQARSIKNNLKNFSHLNSREIEELTPIIFQNFCTTLYDFFYPQELSIDVPQKAKLEKLRQQHKGILMLTFHMGHWELGARTMQEWGWPVTAVYQEYSNKAFREMIQKKRAPGVNFLPVGFRAAQGVLEAFRRGDIVAMLGDHPFGEEGIPVNLLGHQVLWPKGPIVLAVRENIPIVVALIIRRGHKKYEAIIEDPLIPRNHSKEEVRRLVQEVAHKFGNFVEQFPEQWYRFKEFTFVEK